MDTEELSDSSQRYKFFIGMNVNGVSWIGNIYQLVLNPFAISATEISSSFFKCRLTSLWDDKNECSEVCEQIEGEDYLYNVNRKC